MTKTYKRLVLFKHAITSAEATANQADIAIKIAPLPTDDFEFVGQIKRAGVDIPGFDYDYVKATGVLEVKDAGTADLTADDVVIVIGTFIK